MSSLAAAQPLQATQPFTKAQPLKIVDVSGISVPAYRHQTARRRGTSPIAAFAFAVAVIGGTTVAASITGTASTADVGQLTPAAGDFRLSPGNLEPVGIVAGKAVADEDAFGPSRGDFRLSPGNLEPIGIVAGKAVADVGQLTPAAGDFRLSPGNLEPVGIAGS